MLNRKLLTLGPAILLRGCPLLEVIFYGVCIHVKHFGWSFVRLFVLPQSVLYQRFCELHIQTKHVTV